MSESSIQAIDTSEARAQNEMDGYLDRELAGLAQDPEYVANRLALELAEDVAGAMQSAVITEEEMACRMGVPHSDVIRMLDAPPNLTVMTIAKVALALGLTPEVRLRHPHRREARRPWMAETTTATRPSDPAGTETVHAVMEYANGEREPLCGSIFDPAVDAYEDEVGRKVTCDWCIREMRSRGWDIADIGD